MLFNGRLILGLLFLGASIPALAAAEAQGAAQSRAPAAMPEQILVKAKKDLPATAWRALENAHGVRQTGEVRGIGVRIVKVPAARRDAVLEALSRNPNIEFAEPDFEAHLLLTPNDPSYGNQWHLPRINASEGWAVTTGRADQVIAIIDTGVNSNHPDLKGKMLPGYNFIGNNSDASDDQGHGTLVAGAAAATGNNGQGVAGVAWGNWILPVKALDASGGGSHSSIANGITYAADNGARVINLSLGSASHSRTLENAVNYAYGKNIVLIAAAGNTGAEEPFYPAAYPKVVGVSALDSSDQRASFATFGSHVSLSAPGVSILSTHSNGSYGAASGSSFSSPLVAGAAGLVLSITPSLSNSEVVKILEATATDFGPTGYDTSYGHGRLDLAAAVRAASGTPAQDTTAPSVTIVSPQNGTTLSGTANIEVDSFDDVGVSGLELYINGRLVGETAQQAASWTWDTTLWGDGAYVLEAKAYDAAGNVGKAAPVNVTIANAPQTAPATPLTVTITSPSDGSRVGKIVKIAVEAAGGDQLQQIELYVNGTLLGTSTTSPATFNWNVNKEKAGDHRLQAFARDAAGNVADSAVVTVRK